MAIDYTQTPNYGLDKYGDKSPADLRDGHNHNMDIIDQALKNNSDAINKKANADSVYTKAESNALLAERDRKIQTNANSIDSLSRTVDSNKTAQAQKDRQQDDNASIIQSDLNVLENTVTKNAQKEKADIADLDNRKMDKPVHRIICIGDSWGQGWHNGNYPADSPFVTMQTSLSKYWNIERFENVSVSASGYIPNGDSKNFIGQWNSVVDRDQITDVVILGGQNDAAAGTSENDLKGAYHNLCAKIADDTQNKARIWNFWMPLAAGQRMTTNTGTALNNRAILYQALLTEDKRTDNSTTFRGCYRWGDWLGDSLSLGDGAHLTAGGYGYLGILMADCILSGKDAWPDQAQASLKSEINGTWRYDEIIEKNGMITLSFCVDYTQKPNNGALVIALPTFARSGVARFAPNFSGTVFFSMDGDAVRVQNNADLGTSGTLACTMTFPAGY